MTTAKELADKISKAMEDVTDGPWKVYEGCSWRRIGTVGRDYHDCAVLAPTIASDGHPDLTCHRGNDLQANLDYIALCNPDNMRIILSALADAERERDELREWKQSILNCCNGCGSDDLSWGGDKTGWGFIYYFIKHLHTRAEAAEDKLAEALALLSSDPVLYGPYGYINGNRALSEDEWTLENNPIENSDEYFSIPLFAKVDIFSSTTHPSVDRDALLEEARKTLDKPFCVLFLDGRNEHGSHVLPSYPRAFEPVGNDIEDQAEAILAEAERLGFASGEHVWAEFVDVAAQIGDEGRIELSGYWEFKSINVEMSRIINASLLSKLEASHAEA